MDLVKAFSWQVDMKLSDGRNLRVATAQDTEHRTGGNAVHLVQQG